MKKTALRIGVVAGAATALAVSGALSASADVPIGGGGATSSGCSNLHCWAGVLTADIVPIANTGFAAVTWNCQATATIDPTLTSITTCTVAGQSAAPITLPGAYAATAATSIFPIGAVVSACVGGQSTFAENILGSQVVAPPVGCQNVPIVKLPV